jgi:hypothetical protein
MISPNSVADMIIFFYLCLVVCILKWIRINMYISLLCESTANQTSNVNFILQLLCTSTVSASVLVSASLISMLTNTNGYIVRGDAFLSVGIVLGYGFHGRGFDSRPGNPYRLWSPPNLLANGYREIFPRG